MNKKLLFLLDVGKNNLEATFIYLKSFEGKTKIINELSKNDKDKQEYFSIYDEQYQN